MSQHFTPLLMPFANRQRPAAPTSSVAAAAEHADTAFWDVKDHMDAAKT
jgi:hypothetical protein